MQLRVETSDNIANEHFEAGQIVFEQGDVGDRLYFVESGEVEIVRQGVQLAVFGPGEYFGEMALLSNLPRNASARALKPTNLLAIAKGDFAKLVSSIPDFRSDLLDAAARRSIGTGADEQN